MSGIRGEERGSVGLPGESMELHLHRLEVTNRQLMAERDRARRAVAALWSVLGVAEIAQLDGDTVVFAKRCHDGTWHSGG